MKLTIFQSDKGDCLLLQSKGTKPKRILIDGGMDGSYTRHVAPALTQLKKIDVVYVSHIDEDHISGVLQMLDDLVLWRAHKFQKANGNPNHPPPDSTKHPQPPEIGGIWHNAFADQVDVNNAKPLASLLAATAAMLSGARSEALREESEEHRELATSMKQALQVSRRIGPELKIPLNKEFGNKLMMIPNGAAATQLPTLKVGPMKLFILGPFEDDLEKLKKKWNTWLKSKEGKAAVRAVNDESDDNLRDLGQNAMPLLTPLINAAKILGKRSDVTTPNLASLMFLVEEDGRTLLLTGDGHSSDILKGLNFHGKMSAAGDLHVNVLKVQHHGAIANIDEKFCRAVIADNYIFCGNGAHENPETEVIDAIVHSRIGTAAQRSKHAKTGDKFTLWFNSHETASNSDDDRAQMAKVKARVQTLKAQSNGQMDFKFITGSSFPPLPI